MINKEFRIFGPPGTGKTTYLSRQIERGAEKYGEENIIVASYTKAAAFELNSRKLPIPKDNMGTLHALCYRAMGSPEIAETHINNFNEEYPQFILTPEKGSLDDPMSVESSHKTPADWDLNAYNIHRARMEPWSSLPKSLKPFIKAWEAWKTKYNYIDFMNMIEYTLLEKSPPPGNPSIGIYDEVQDFNKLQLTLIRHWCSFQEYIILAGDDDQSIYEWIGSTPDAFLLPEISPENKRVLQQSYRLPKIVQQYSSKWISQIKNREPKTFKPRDAEGEVKSLFSNYKAPLQAIELAHKYSMENKSVMFLTTCGYMLNDIKKELRQNGIPYHNPYRRNRGDWNPLGNFHRKTSSGKISTRERILAFFDDQNEGHFKEDYWSMEQLVKWVELIKATGNLKRGAKEKLSQIAEAFDGPFREVSQQFYESVFEEFALRKALARDPAWLYENLLSDKRTAAEYPLTVLKKWGMESLKTPPKIIISTIHGVKGGEADVVILFPDMSMSGMRQFMSKAGRDEIIRTFYVGMTRAREKLIICKPATPFCVTLP